MAKRHPQTKIFEFKPSENITNNEIIELCGLIRIGVSGEILEKASEELKNHFREVIKNEISL